MTALNALRERDPCRVFRGFRLLDMLSVSRPEISWSPPGETWWTWWSPPSRGSCWTSAEDWAYGTCCVSPEPSSLDFIFLQAYNDEVVTKFLLYPRVTHQPTTHKLPQNELSMRQLWSDLDIFWPLFGTTRGEDLGTTLSWQSITSLCCRPSVLLGELPPFFTMGFPPPSRSLKSNERGFSGSLDSPASADCF